MTCFIQWFFGFFFVISLGVEGVFAAGSSTASASPPRLERSIEERPDIVEKIRSAVEKMGKSKTGEIKVSMAKETTSAAKSRTVSAHNKSVVTPLAWGYSGAQGPRDWAGLSSDYRLCGIGQRQSPIAIDDADTLVLENMEQLGFDYGPVGGWLRSNRQVFQFDLPVASPQVWTEEPQLRVRGNSYRLTHIQFHMPAEEQINGQRYALSAHLFHRNAAGEVAVVAVLFDPGPANPAIQTLWANIPLDDNDRVVIPSGSLDLNSLLPSDKRYYQYLGSLTTPPCSEGVLWLVLKQVRTISDSQLAVFNKLFGQNARPLQAVNGRIIKSAQ